MLRVIKKNLKEVDFVADKIKTSVANSASDVNFTLNQTDLNLISSDVEKKLIQMRGRDGKTSSYEIQSIVLESLCELGFQEVSDSFYNGGCDKIDVK